MNNSRQEKILNLIHKYNNGWISEHDLEIEMVKICRDKRYDKKNM